MDLSNLRPADGAKHNDNFRRGRDTVLEMARQPVRDIKARRLVQEQQDLVLKVARCHCIEEYQREGLLAETLKKSLVLM